MAAPGFGAQSTSQKVQSTRPLLPGLNAQGVGARSKCFSTSRSHGCNVCRDALPQRACPAPDFGCPLLVCFSQPQIFCCVRHALLPRILAFPCWAVLFSPPAPKPKSWRLHAPRPRFSTLHFLLPGTAARRMQHLPKVSVSTHDSAFFTGCQVGSGRFSLWFWFDDFSSACARVLIFSPGAQRLHRPALYLAAVCFPPP